MSVLNADDIVKCSGDIVQALNKKKKEAAQHMDETGSLPPWWEVGICVGKTRGVPPKFSGPEEFFSKGYEYFAECAAQNIQPTKAGLTLHMGFTTFPTFQAHVRRHPEMRDAHGTFMTLLKLPVEMEMTKPGGQQGKAFVLKNIPDGWSSTDPVDAPVTYEWQDRKITELTGPGGAALEISRKMSPEEGYLAMLEGGRLADEEEKPGE